MRSPELGAVLFTLGERASIKSYGDDLCRALDLTAGTSHPILMRGRVETRWEQDPPKGRPVRHLSLIGPPLQLLRGPFSEVSPR